MQLCINQGKTVLRCLKPKTCSPFWKVTLPVAKVEQYLKHLIPSVSICSCQNHNDSIWLTAMSYTVVGYKHFVTNHFPFTSYQ